MPQECYVLRCFSCNVFQVHIVKKSSKKWVCKLCGEKQTIIKVYGQGSAKDCRDHVQKLNLLRGTAAEIQEQASALSATAENLEEVYCDDRHPSKCRQPYGDAEDQPSVEDVSLLAPKPKASKWDCFLDDPEGSKLETDK